MARKPVGQLFVWAIPILGTMVSPGELRAEPPTEAALLPQLAVDQGGGRVQGQDHSHRPKNDSGHRDPKQPSKRFHPGLCPSQRGPEFAEEGAEIPKHSQVERQPRGPGHASESCFWSVALGTAQGRQVEEREAPWRIDRDRSGGKCGLPCDVIR